MKNYLLFIYHLKYNGDAIQLCRKVIFILLATSLSHVPVFSVSGDDVSLKETKVSHVRQDDQPATFVQQRTVTGKITDSEGLALPGVNVVIMNTMTGAISDVNGNYSIDITVPDAVLMFSYVGYITESVTAGERTVINVTLQPDIALLEDVVVVGYGSMRKSDLTGSVISVNSEDFVQGVTTNALQLLSGKASGVFISQANSEPGGNLSVRIRGAGSINSSNNPLIVIDGLPGGSAANINPADIESIEVLKDASAAAIYGTRAANGVILITTKKGKEGAPQISYNTYYAYQTPSYKFDVLNGKEYMQMINDILLDQGQPAFYSDAQINAAGAGVDWQDELLRNSWASNHQFSVNGGHRESKYYVSLGYTDQDGIMVSSGIKKYHGLLNLELNPTDKFRFGVNLNGNMNLKDQVPNENDGGNEGADPLNSALAYDPNVSPEKDENGQFQRNALIEMLDNPVALSSYDYRQQNNRLYGSAFAEFKITNDLTVSYKLGADLNNIRNDEYTNKATNRGKQNGGIGEVESLNLKYWLSEGILRYNKTIGRHNLSLMGGTTWERFENLSQSSRATGFLSDVTNTNQLQSGITETQRVTSSKNVYKLQSLIGRVNYTFHDKYLLTATIRRDGTSRFSAANKYALFPSLALGWRIDEEPFMDQLQAVSSLKLRFGYGQLGNEGIGNFETIETYIAGGNTVLGGAIQNGAVPARIPNSELTWETTEEFNYGVDFGFLEDRIMGSIEYYQKNTNDQLFSKPVPMSTGFTSVRTNFGTVRNSGLDVALTTHNLTGKFNWTTDLMFSTLKNEVVELPPYAGDIIVGGVGNNMPGYAIVREGLPMMAFYGYKVTGIFQDEDEIAGSAQPAANPGDPIFLDNNDDKVIDAKDRVVLGDPFPDLIYSLNNSFSYRNFTLDIYVLGVKGIHTFNVNMDEFMFPMAHRNILSELYFNRWTPENRDTKFPSGVNPAAYLAGGKRINSYTIQDASYLRLKNISLSYNVPMNKSGLFKSVLLSVIGDNLLTFTDFDGYDPEANQTGDGTGIQKASYNNYPAARAIRFGANITF